MSNLGAYQWLTTAAKKVGGPKNLVLIIAGTGAAVYKGSEIVVKKTVKEIKKKIRIHQLTEMDKDAVLIEKIDDDDNPYFVSEKLLTNISNYKC